MSGTPPLGADDNDRTVIRPSPGGRLPPTTAPAAAARTWADAPASPEPESSPVINTPLAVAATPLLQLLARLQNTARPPHPGELRERVVQEIRTFERRAREAGIAPDVLRPTHYALCASLDDVVLNTPWGAAGNWHGRTLVSVFHRDAGGSAFFATLHRIKQDPERFLPAIEVMYLCLSLGCMGQYRPPSGDAAGFDQLRNELCGIILRHRPAADADLSPRWEGIHAPYRAARRRLPVWVAAVAAVAASAACFVLVSDELNTASDNAYARLLAAPPGHMPRISRLAYVHPPAAPPPSVEPDAMDRLRGLLKSEIATGHVSVAGTAASPIVRLENRGLFVAGRAALQASAVPLLEHIGAALKSEPGSVRVIGYTDNQPVHSVRFASNFQLSLARAQAVGAVVAGALGDAGRVTADGRADADPIGSNATADGRELNRRIEIVLHRQDQQD